jgi:hypothetical protein
MFWYDLFTVLVVAKNQCSKVDFNEETISAHV